MRFLLTLAVLSLLMTSASDAGQHRSHTRLDKVIQHVLREDKKCHYDAIRAGWFDDLEDEEPNHEFRNPHDWDFGVDGQLQPGCPMPKSDDDLLDDAPFFVAEPTEIESNDI